MMKMTPSCEFGVCGGINIGSSFTAGVITAPLTWCGEHPTVCTIGEDVAGFIRAIPAAVASGMLLSMEGDNRATSATSVVDCWNQYAKDLQACKEAYPPGPQRQECFQKAKARLDFCRGNIKGPVQ